METPAKVNGASLAAPSGAGKHCNRAGGAALYRHAFGERIGNLAAGGNLAAARVPRPDLAAFPKVLPLVTADNVGFRQYQGGHGNRDIRLVFIVFAAPSFCGRTLTCDPIAGAAERQ
jgi:hypothetical protein